MQKTICKSDLLNLLRRNQYRIYKIDGYGKIPLIARDIEPLILGMNIEHVTNWESLVRIDLITTAGCRYYIEIKEPCSNGVGAPRRVPVLKRS